MFTQNSIMQIKISFSQAIVFGILMLCCSCSKPPHADFELQTDPRYPGKIKCVNKSSNNDENMWTFCEKSESGLTVCSPDHYSELSSPVFYYVANGTKVITLTVYNGNNEDSKEQIIEINDIPRTVVITDVVVTRLNDTNTFGELYDAEDNSASDVFFKIFDGNLTMAQYYSPEPGEVYYDRAGLSFPYTCTVTGSAYTYTNMSPQTHEFLFYIFDYDNAGYGMGKWTTMGSIEFNPYHYTNLYNDGSDNNYPDTLVFSNSQFEAEVHMKWTVE